MDDGKRAFRAEVLASYGAKADTLEELLAYNAKPFPPEIAETRPAFPLEDEAHVEAWRGYERESRETDAFAALKRHFVQLRFPIRRGISEDDAYRQATRRGLLEAADAYAHDSVALDRPDLVDLTIVPTIAGHVPVIVVGDRRDFIKFVQAFSERNEPTVVPDAMGACIVKGLNNWSRIRAYRARWEQEQGSAASDESWAAEFQQLIPRKELYQDRFIILSRGPYSAIAARDAGYGEAEWLERSLVIRRDHELTHYFTYRVFNAIRSNVFDELIADFVGLVRAFGSYRADLALRFLGLEGYPAWRAGGRLEVYRGKPPLSDDAFAVARTLAVHSARNLEAFALSNTELLRDLTTLAAVTFALTGTTLEELASSEMPRLVRERLS
jgi:Family of unknown function (DUF7005)